MKRIATVVLFMIAILAKGYADNNEVPEELTPILKEESLFLSQIVDKPTNEMLRIVKNRHPENMESFNIVQYYIESLEAIDLDQVVDYTNQVNQIVLDSSIPSSSKSLINNSLSVGMNSANLWDNNY